MKRLFFNRCLFLFSSICFLLSSCSPKPKLVMVFVDVSGSVHTQDRIIYRQTTNNLLEQLRPGDRFVLGTISTESYSTFVPIIDETLPKTGIRLNDEEASKRIIANIRQQLVNLIDGNFQSPQTRIIESCRVASDIRQRDGVRKECWLVFLSDMVEESDLLNFTRNIPNPSEIPAFVDQLRQNGSLPNLNGIKVYVAGAGGGANAGRIQNFWETFLRECGVKKIEYGRTAINSF